MAEKVLGIDGGIALSAVRSIVGAISAKDPGGFSEAGMRTWIADNAKNAARKAEDVKIAELADLRWAREVQQELGIRCEGGYACGR